MFVGGKLEVLGGKMKHPAKVTLVNVQCINGKWRNLFNFIHFSSVCVRKDAGIRILYISQINNEMTRVKI